MRARLEFLAACRTGAEDRGAELKTPLLATPSKNSEPMATAAKRRRLTEFLAPILASGGEVTGSPPPEALRGLLGVCMAKKGEGESE